MQAAAEASNAPFLLLIDALNEAERPKAWREELPALLAEIANKPWIALGVSIRSSYRELVLPEEGVPNVEEIEHSGFAGRDTEAVERFFAAFDLGPPQTPQFALEFTNPLFLKLYCETMVDLGPSCIGDRGTCRHARRSNQRWRGHSDLMLQRARALVDQDLVGGRRRSAQPLALRFA